MPLRLTITSFQRLSPGRGNHQDAHRGSIASAGRRKTNGNYGGSGDAILSGRHCTLHYQDGGYFLTDTSTNGVYLGNDSDGARRPQSDGQVEDGDHFVLGEYEIAVTLLSEGAGEVAGSDSSRKDQSPRPCRFRTSAGLRHRELGGGLDSLIKPSFSEMTTGVGTVPGLRQVTRNRAKGGGYRAAFRFNGSRSGVLRTAGALIPENARRNRFPKDARRTHSRNGAGPIPEMAPHRSNPNRPPTPNPSSVAV